MVQVCCATKLDQFLTQRFFGGGYSVFEKSSSFCRENDVFKNKTMDQFSTQGQILDHCFNSTACIYIYIYCVSRDSYLMLLQHLEAPKQPTRKKKKTKTYIYIYAHIYICICRHTDTHTHIPAHALTPAVICLRRGRIRGEGKCRKDANEPCWRRTLESENKRDLCCGFCRLGWYNAKRQSMGSNIWALPCLRQAWSWPFQHSPASVRSVGPLVACAQLPRCVLAMAREQPDSMWHRWDWLTPDYGHCLSHGYYTCLSLRLQNSLSAQAMLHKKSHLYYSQILDFFLLRVVTCVGQKRLGANSRSDSPNWWESAPTWKIFHLPLDSRSVFFPELGWSLRTRAIVILCCLRVSRTRKDSPKNFGRATHPKDPSVLKIVRRPNP